jgi:subtilisin family serine protease
MAERDDILAVALFSPVSMCNFATRWITQAYTTQETPLSAAGLDGTDQIVGVGDTGIDADSCFFADVTSAVPFRSVNYLHRKIVAYWPDADSADTVEGHGTHVAGSIAGEAPAGSALARFNGIAPKAKLAFTDISNSKTLTVLIPNDVAGDYFSRPYQVGARIHSDSWGTGDSAYDARSASLDAFAADHRDFLPILAAGNDGAKSWGSVGAPCVAKNTLCVGATESAAHSFAALGVLPWVMRVLSAAGAELASFELDAARTFGKAPYAIRHIRQPTPEPVRAHPLLCCRYVMTPIVAPLAMADPPSACLAMSPAPGRVVVATRGDCYFTEKAAAAQRAGAVALIVMNSEAGRLSMGGSGAIDIAVFALSKTASASLQRLMEAAVGVSAQLPLAPNATDYSISNVAAFSSRGPAADGRTKPDIVAPGFPIISARSDGNTSTRQCSANQVGLLAAKVATVANRGCSTLQLAALGCLGALGSAY